MPLHLKYLGNTTVPVEIEGFTPDWACDKSLTEIERFEIFHGNRKIPLAEMFKISGNSSDKHIEFEGDLSGVHWIGAHMQSGKIHIHGSAGRHLGSAIRGGEIHVHGNVQDWLGAEMHAGLIHVTGNAGHWVGGAYRGSVKGMTGGTVLVEGNAGNEAGIAMRRGMIAIRGSAGDLTGYNMLAGTVLVFGDCGIRPGAGMRRGTICLLSANRPPLLPTFRYVCTAQPTVLPVMLRHVAAQGFAVNESLLHSEFDFYQGDFVALGRGEIVLQHL